MCKKAPSAGRTSRNFDKSKRITQPSGAAMPAFFGSTPGQDPKAAKFAVLTPGPGMFVNVQYVSGVVIMELPAAKSGSGEFHV